MEKTEVVKLFKEINKFYFNRIKLSEQELIDSVNSFYLVLRNYDSTMVLQNLYDHIKASPFPPTVSDLVKERTVELKSDVPGVEQTRLMLKEKEFEETNVSKEFIKQQIQEGLRLAREGKRNANKRDFNPFK